jgi:S1/P1 Nuclease
VCFGNITNATCAAGERANLHSVWDTWIPRRIVGVGEHASRAEEKVAAAIWASKLYTRQMAGGVRAAGCAMVRTPDVCSVVWAMESNAHVCSYVFKPSVEWLQTNDLSGEYYEGAVAVVEGLIAKAGVRLAAWLEACVAALESDRIRVREQQALGSLEL